MPRKCPEPFKRPRSPFYQYDFVADGCRFVGSTKTANRREAEGIVLELWERARRDAREGRAVKASLRLDDVTGLYWAEIGCHHAGADDTLRDLGRIVDHFGADRLITDITHADVSAFIAKRRLDVSPATGKPISNATVNRSCTVVLKKVMRFVADGSPLVLWPNVIKWKKLMLTEPLERVRELHTDEAEKLDEATRDDYRPFFEFLHATAVRFDEAVSLTWDQVNFDMRLITRPGKGGQRVTNPITATLYRILSPLRGHHAISVFTYVAKRNDKRKGLVKGQRYPITYQGAKTAWRRLRKKAKVAGFRLHDLRHDTATKLLRDTHNLKLVQKALNHASLKTTAKYAHVLQDDVADALERVQSRTTSRTGKLKAV